MPHGYFSAEPTNSLFSSGFSWVSRLGCPAGSDPYLDLNLITDFSLSTLSLAPGPLSSFSPQCGLEFSSLHFQEAGIPSFLRSKLKYHLLQEPFQNYTPSERVKGQDHRPQFSMGKVLKNLWPPLGDPFVPHNAWGLSLSSGRIWLCPCRPGSSTKMDCVRLLVFVSSVLSTSLGRLCVGAQQILIKAMNGQRQGCMSSSRDARGGTRW